MKELTFKSYLKNYVRDISGINTLDITRLVNEISNGNTELKEPLILYCILCDKVSTLKNVIRRTPDFDMDLGETSYTEKDIKSAKSSAPATYKSIYQAYLEEKKDGKISHEHKENLRKQILKLNKKHNISMRKLSIIAGVDSSNFNTFMKNKEYPKVSTERLEKVVSFLEEKE